MPSRPGRDLTAGTVAALALLLLAVAVMAVGGESRLFGDTKEFLVVFPSAEGLRPGSPVTMAGVQIGTVTGIRLPTDPKATGIEVTLGVQQAYAARVREGSLAGLRFLQWLSGEKYVDVLPGDPSLPALREGAEIPPQEPNRILEQGEDIAQNLNEITVSLKEILVPLQKGEGLLGEMLRNPDFGKEGLAALRGALENLEELSGRLNAGEGFAGRLLLDPDLEARAETLAGAIDKLATFVDALAAGEGGLGELVREGGAGDRIVGDLAETSASLRRIAADLERPTGLAGRILHDEEYSEGLAADLRSLVARLESIARKVDEGEGTLGRLVNDATLHDAAEEIVAGVDDSRFAKWLLRHYRKKGIRSEEDDTGASP